MISIASVTSYNVEYFTDEAISLTWAYNLADGLLVGIKREEMLQI